MHTNDAFRVKATTTTTTTTTGHLNIVYSVLFKVNPKHTMFILWGL